MTVLHEPDARSRWDLHMHTTLSDGVLEPTEVLRCAAVAGLDVVAITDHDLGPVLEPGEHSVEGNAIHLLHAAEMTTLHEQCELHVLVYFAGSMPDEFRRFCRLRVQARAERYERIRQSLGLEGVEEACAMARRGERSLTRHHIARSLVGAGHCRSIDEAFKTVLSRSNVPVGGVEIATLLALARDCGGVTSWAHPIAEQAQRWAGDFAKMGLHALEGARPRQGRVVRNGMKRLAKKHGLAVTGGSDWHGWGTAKLGDFAVDGQQVASFARLLVAA
ncbi:MAG: hypothetical protein VX519_10925 [Myxococcota bacterium]|nr:hypothetical protein [Myxococcota bacterium]